MRRSFSPVKKVYAGLLCLSLFLPHRNASAGDANATAVMGTVLSGGALVYSVYQAVSYASQCSSVNWGACAQAAMYTAAAGLSGLALAQSLMTDKATRDSRSSGGGSSSGTVAGEVAGASAGTSSGSVGGGTGIFSGLNSGNSSGTNSGLNSGTNGGDSPNFCLLPGNPFCGEDGRPRPDIERLPDVCSRPDAQNSWLCRPDAADQWRNQVNQLRELAEKGLIDTGGKSPDDFVGGMDAGMQSLIAALQEPRSPRSGEGLEGSKVATGAGAYRSSDPEAGGSGNMGDSSAAARNGRGIFGFGRARRGNGLSLEDDETGKELSLFQRATRLYQGTAEGVVTGKRANTMARLEQIRSQAIKQLALNKNSHNSTKISALTSLESKKSSESEAQRAPASSSLASPVRPASLPQH